MKLGVLGVWYGENYGSVLTYWALERTLRSLGHEVCMIQKPSSGRPDPEIDGNHALRFAQSHFSWISPSLKLQNYPSLNDELDGFVIGSDQVWNYGINKRFGHSFYLDFAEDSKRKLSYAASFGHAVDFAPPEERVIISSLLARFDGISVREATGVALAQEVYGVDAVRVLDPVFLPSREEYETIIDESDWEPPSQYILSYILDPTPEKVDLIKRMSASLGLPLVNILDGRGNRRENEAALGMPALENMSAALFLKAFERSSFVITDSFHGTSFSIVFSKPFVSIPNKARGTTRFDNILSLTGLQTRAWRKPELDTDITPFLEHIDYARVSSILDRERTVSLRWLKRTLAKPKATDTVTEPQDYPTVYEYNSQNDFSFDPDLWTSSVSRNGIRLSPRPGYAKRGIQAALPLNSVLREGRRYRMWLDFETTTTSPILNVHIKNSQTGKFQVIHQFDDDVISNHGTKTSIVFIPDADGYDQFMIGAVHLQGDEAYFVLKSMVLEDLSTS